MSMENNLIFYGLSEPGSLIHGESAESDKCEQLVWEFIAEALHIGHKLMVIERDTVRKERKQGVGMRNLPAYRDAKKAFNDYIDVQKLRKDETRILGNEFYHNN